jgi:glyoxylase-like metal-dependent hydrolase (beta-lactamase superfamily II)/ferredoxin
MKTHQQIAILSLLVSSVTLAFVPSSASSRRAPDTSLRAAPRRLEDNVDGPLYVNDKCINCAACSMMALDVFSRRPGDGAHVVHQQPNTDTEIDDARAALAACPVAAIRVETKAHRTHRNQEPLSPEQETLASKLAINPKFNGLPVPFPRAGSRNVPDVYFVGHHNEKSFGAVPYLFQTQQHGWILVDTPEFSKSAVQAVETLTGPEGPSYMLLTHVDDTAGHSDWKERYPNLQRIFHAGDLGRHNWLGDLTLEHVEILLKERSADDHLQFFDIQGNPLEDLNELEEEIVLVHTPGHSPGSMTLWKRPITNDSTPSPGVLFTGDTYSFTTRGGGQMTGFPRYGNDRPLQGRILPKLLELDWQFVAPGHGHVRDYTTNCDDKDTRQPEMEPAIQELMRY